ncbi:putative ribonuclease H-like domain-containing protein [Tanacetum coccineum]
MSQPANDVFSQHLSDDEASFHEDASDNVWKAIQNGNSKKSISTRKDGVIRVLPPVFAAEIHMVEKERRARTILLMAIPKEHLRRFHGMDYAKEIWRSYKDRFGGNAKFNEDAESLEAHSDEVSTECKSKFLRSFPAWSLSRKEVSCGFADEVIYSLFVKQSKDLDLLHEDLEQIDDLDIEEMDINWQIAMIAIRMKKFYKKTGRRVWIDGNKPVGFDKKKLECFKCHNTGHFARECTPKGDNLWGKKRDSFYQDQGAGKKEQNQNCLLTMDDGVVNWGEHTVEEVDTNHALMAINSNNEVSLCSKTCIDSYNKLKKQCDEQMNQLGDQEVKILAYDQAVQAVKKLEAQVKIVDSWKDSSKILWKLVDSGMSSTSKVGLGYEIKSNDEVLSYEEEMNRTVFNCTAEDFIDKPLYSRFTKTNNFKGVLHPLSGDYTPKPQQEIDESLYVYGKKRPQKPEISDSDDTSNEHSTCQSNDSKGSFGNPSKHSSESESESISVPNEMFTSKSITTNEKDMSESKEVEPSCVTHVKTPRQQIHKVKGKNWNEIMERELGEGYSFIKKKCFVCGSLSHLIRDCDFYEKKMAREAELKKQRVFNTGNGVAKPVWNNANRVNRANHFIPRPVQLNTVRQNVNSVRPNVNTGRANVNSVKSNVNSVRPNVNTGRANVNSVKSNVNSVRHNVNSVRTNVNTGRSKQPVPTSNSNSFSPVRPQVNKFNQRSHFSKSHSPVRRPIVRNTARMTYSHAVKGNWGTAVKTSAGYNWRRTRPNSNYNSGSNFVRTDHPLKNMEDRGIFDSGCSGHMTGNKDHLDDFEECKGGSVTFGGSKGYITGKGRIRVGNLDFDSVSFVKELGHFNLFSISQICDKHHKVLFTETECLVVSPDFKMPDENQILLKVPRQHNMYSFDMKTPSLTKDYACLIAKATSDESKLWHRRLGHINFKNLNKLVKGNLVRGLPSKVFRNDHTCVACQKGKQHKASCKAKLERTITEPLHTLHMDLFGPTSVKSINHASYCLVITDDYTKFSWVFFLATKDETIGILKNFIAILPVVAHNAGQADQVGTQFQPSSSTVPPPHTSQPAPTESTTIPPTPTEPTSVPSSPSPAPEHETMKHPFEQLSPEHQPSSPRHELAIPQTQAPTHTHEAETGHMSVDDLFQLVPQLMTRIESLEKDLKQTKQTMGNAIVKLVKKVKKLEKVVKGRRVVLTDSEDEAAENSSKQGRNLQKDESEVFETPKQGKSSGETDISPQGLEAAKTLAEVLSQIKTKRRNVKTGVRRRLDAEDVSTGFEGFEDVSTGFTDIKSASEKVSSGGEHVSASQREGKAVLEETPQTKRTKKQIREEQASLAEIARIQAEDEAKNARREELKRQDELAAKRLQEELELSEAQKKRMAQVQEAAQFYTEEDWDTIRAKLEANADLVKEIAGEDVSEADYAQRMGGWKLAQIKKLTDEELKVKFKYLMRSMERFVPMDTEKESRKRTGEELQTESSKKLKSDTREDVSVPKEKDKESVKREEEFEIKKPVLRYTKRKSLARKGLQKKPESGTEEDIEAYMEERVDEPEDNTDVVYVNFQGLLNDLTRDDLKELYRLMMLKYGDNRPEEEFERVLWGDLKTMFDPPSTEDAVWNLTHQQKVLSWRYFHSCVVHCLTLEAAHIYMLTEVKYPLPSRVCQAMLEKKLLGDRKDEFTMSNRHKDWLVQEQTALGKDFSNPFMADNLPKIVWLSTHHIYVCKELASPQDYGLW